MCVCVRACFFLFHLEIILKVLYLSTYVGAKLKDTPMLALTDMLYSHVRIVMYRSRCKEWHRH